MSAKPSTTGHLVANPTRFLTGPKLTARSFRSGSDRRSRKEGSKMPTVVDDQVCLEIEEIATDMEFDNIAVAMLGDPELEEVLMCAQCIGECKIH